MSKKGFTLVEILVVAVIIALLASAIFYGYTQFRKQGNDSRRVLDLNNDQKALELYYSTYLKYPDGPAYSDMVTQVTSAGIGVSKMPDDPLAVSAGRHYLYGVSSDKQSYVLGATLEVANTTGPPLSNDIDGTVYGIDCDDTNKVYCIQP